MLTVVTWKWRTPGFRSVYTAEHVRIMQRMIARHYPQPHRFVCATDDAKGLDGIETIPLWSDHRTVASPHGRGQPACYVRLKAFAPEMRAVLGERFVSVDLDAVVVGDLTPVFERTEPFVIWRHGPHSKSNGPKSRYNGSMWMLAAGARPQVWERFQGTASAREAYSRGHHGSDQGWMSYVLGNDEASWTGEHGVYSYKYQVVALNGGKLPKNARIVFFHGKPDPWEEMHRVPWVREHWQ